jgi:hypothetical protein
MIAHRVRNGGPTIVRAVGDRLAGRATHCDNHSSIDPAVGRMRWAQVLRLRPARLASSSLVHGEPLPQQRFRLERP